MGLFDAIGNFFGGIIDNAWADERQANQNDWNEQMWEKQAEWNSPAHQMQMMRDAGINPAFAAAGISGSPGYTPPAGSQSMPMSNAFSNFGTNSALGQLYRSESENKDTETEWMGRLNQSTIDQTMSEINKNKSIADLNDEQKKVIRESLEMQKGKTAKEIEKMTEEMKQINAAVLQINALTNKIKVEEENIEADTANKQAMNEQISAQTENIRQDTELKKQEESTSASLENLNLKQIDKMSAEIGLINTQKACEELRQAQIKSATQLSKAQIVKTLRDAMEKDIDIWMKAHGYSESLSGTIARSITMGENAIQRTRLNDIISSYEVLLGEMEQLDKDQTQPKLVFPEKRKLINPSLKVDWR